MSKRGSVPRPDERVLDCEGGDLFIVIVQAAVDDLFRDGRARDSAFAYLFGPRGGLFERHADLIGLDAQAAREALVERLSRERPAFYTKYERVLERWRRRERPRVECGLPQEPS